MQAPQHDAERHQAESRRMREGEVRGNQQRESRDQQRSTTHAIGKPAGRIRRERIHHVHHDQHHRRITVRQPEVARAQNEKRFAEAGERKDAADDHHPPIVLLVRLTITSTAPKIRPSSAPTCS